MSAYFLTEELRQAIAEVEGVALGAETSENIAALVQASGWLAVAMNEPGTEAMRPRMAEVRQQCLDRAMELGWSPLWMALVPEAA